MRTLSSNRRTDLINGTDYMDMKLSDLQKLIAMVSQDVQPLAFSVVENIAASETEQGSDRAVPETSWTLG